MSVRISHWVWEHSGASGNDLLLLLALADQADDHGRCWPSQDHLARKTKLSRRTVQRRLADMADHGTVIRKSIRSGTSNVYEFVIGPPSEDLRQNDAGVRHVDVGQSDVGQSDGTTPGDAGGASLGVVGGASPGDARTVKEPSTNHQTSPKPPRPDVEAICELLAERMEANGNRRPTITANWRDSARRMLDLDKRPLAEVRRLIGWSQDHDFWRAVIHSMPKFRDKYDQLRLQAEREHRPRLQASGGGLYEGDL